MTAGTDLDAPVEYAESRCTLTARPAAKRFLYPQLNRFLAELFEGIPNGTHLSQLPKVSLAVLPLPSI